MLVENNSLIHLPMGQSSNGQWFDGGNIPPSLHANARIE